MNARGLALGASLLLATTVHCGTPDDEVGEPDDPPLEDAPLDLQVDAVDVVHGALRVRATMTGGSPDVSVALGGSCEAREVGAGLSTATTLTWTLGENDVVDAIDCGLVVRATVHVGRRTGNRLAPLGVSVSLTAPPTEGEGSTEEGESTEQEAEEDNSTQESGQEPAQPSEPEPAQAPADQPAADPGTANVTPPADLVRALLLHRQIVVEGNAFDVAVDVGGVPLS
jgi:hypothetical protein